MILKKCLSIIYPTVDPFVGINTVEDLLLENQYLVIIDDDNNYHGILTVSDIIKRPHKLVIDCVTKKESLELGESFSSAFEKIYLSNSFVLPVMNGSNFVGVIEKRQILRELEAKVNELHQKALISEKSKDYFLKNLSHEIRTPLNGILGFYDLITDLNANYSKIQKESFSKSIRQSSDHFLMIMRDLVELSFIHAGDKINIIKDDVDIVKIFIELKTFFSETLLFQEIKPIISYSNSEYSFRIHTDENKLKRILYHLINNAIKFSEDNSVIFGFELDHNKGNVIFFVKNNIANTIEKEALKMFDIFEKQETIENQMNFGLGIGLPLVKKLTYLLGGYVNVEIKNKEISFFVNIPFEHKETSVYNLVEG